MYVCIDCRKGLMDPVSRLDEPDAADRYQCSYCGHRATIPPLMISVTQILSCILGLGFTLYLLLQHVGRTLKAFQLGLHGDMTSDVLLSALALLFTASFGYTILRAGHNLRTQFRYRHVRPSS
ncbi:hypothetical protein EZI54_01985 [Marinobacter halodurans]|uniref:Uncharacterized protein n=1 Tax=Marinobacter halodurans TaxID=2528979 RepID=A0ABY1ZQL4_9GAMM|nr:hypothetical protein [Marinobacter halodurans]TBW59105.1 hypothetical protein EZI54_01985 [Marinobacter halodurans]